MLADNETQVKNGVFGGISTEFEVPNLNSDMITVQIRQGGIRLPFIVNQSCRTLPFDNNKIDKIIHEYHVSWNQNDRHRKYYVIAENKEQIKDWVINQFSSDVAISSITIVVQQENLNFPLITTGA
jgi:hypothetical protein